ncbi:MAG TPA: hypothetical protein VMF69_15395 [Gemmataceae bacterium]|nr:hypothetical protein [Gemmataceae bacterium]
MTDTLIELTEEAFAALYPLRTNHLNPAAGWTNGQGAGCLFETYGEELAFIHSQNPRSVWTLIDGDDGDQRLLSGFHLVNRIGYLISTVPVPEGTTIQIHIPMQSKEVAEVTTHTSEPWHVPPGTPVAIFAPDARTLRVGIAIMEPLAPRDLQRANARRICASVNACQGIGTEALERGLIAELLAVLQEAREEIAYRHSDMLNAEERGHPRGNGWARVYDHLSAILAKATRRAV